MNAAIEFHDSEISSVVSEAGRLYIRFSAAYIHKSVGVPGVDSGGGYVQAIVIQLERAQWIGQLNECVGKLSDGKLEVNGQEQKLVPLPFTVVGHIRLTLQFSNGTELSVTAGDLEVSQIGEARYIESFAC